MYFWKKVKQAAIVDRFVEEKLYEQALHEFQMGMRRDGLWAKAFRKSNGDKQKANALYLEYRVQSIKDEAEISGVLLGQREQERNSLSNDINVKANSVENQPHKKIHFTRHKGYELQCAKCGFIAFSVAKETAIGSKCLGCGNIMAEELPKVCKETLVNCEPSGSWCSRVLCSDGTCIGIIGADGNCKECGRPSV